MEDCLWIYHNQNLYLSNGKGKFSLAGVVPPILYTFQNQFHVYIFVCYMFYLFFFVYFGRIIPWILKLR